jgi:hypothetical protein
MRPALHLSTSDNVVDDDNVVDNSNGDEDNEEEETSLIAKISSSFSSVK